MKKGIAVFFLVAMVVLSLATLFVTGCETGSGGGSETPTPTQSTSISPTPTSSGTGTLTGQVTESEHDSPVPNTSIVVFDSNNNTVGSGTTDENGMYTISNIPAGIITVQASRVSYYTATYQDNINAGETTTLNMTITPAN